MALKPLHLITREVFGKKRKEKEEAQRKCRYVYVNV